MSAKKVLYCVICVCVCAKASVLSGKGLYCKDPDVGSYHPVNSTWSSITFCGNYTCKIRKKTSNVTVDIPPEVLIIDDISKDGTDLDQSHTAIDLDQSHAGSETQISIAERPATGRAILHTGVLADFHDPEARRQLLKDIQDKIFTSLNDNEDRYLTDDEISTISALLKVVKKSDLEALFEIYTLAKDIFQEIDATSESHSSIDKSKTVNSKEPLKTESAFPGTGGYFYDSMINQWVEMSGAVTQKITPVPTYHSPLIKGLYYKKHYTPEDSGHTNHKIKPRNSSCPFQTPEVPPPYHWIMQKPEPRVPLLPMPFSYLYQNNAVYPYSDLTNTKPISVKSFNIPGNVITTRELKPEYNHNPIKKAINDANSNLLHKILPASKVDVISEPQWKTEELSPEAIEDVRANVLQKSQKRSNIFPMRRKVKLERVGKVLKMDRELTRRKRENKDLEDSGEVEYEVFIEKITCDSNLEFGFFRVGNQSLPYPACCPVKIE